jgi:hypothetical protein
MWERPARAPFSKPRVGEGRLTMTVTRVECEVGGRTLSFETGKIAKQAVAL